jgi:hypothetical protein
MNTPPPCNSCANLYVNCLHKNDPNYLAECKKGHELGDECEDYEYWQSVHKHYREKEKSNA